MFCPIIRTYIQRGITRAIARAQSDITRVQKNAPVLQSPGRTQKPSNQPRYGGNLPIYCNTLYKERQVIFLKCRKCKEALPDMARFCPYCGTLQQQERKTKSRGNGTGSVYRRNNGTWIAVKTLGYTIGEIRKNQKARK